MEANKKKKPNRKPSGAKNSEHRIRVFGIQGLNEDDLRSLFPYAVEFEIKSNNNGSSTAFVSFRDPAIVEKVVDKGSIFCRKLKKMLGVKPAKIFNQKDEDNLIARLNRTQAIESQKNVGFSLIGHDEDKIVDLSVNPFKFKLRVSNKASLAKTIVFVRVGKKDHFSFQVNWRKVKLAPGCHFDLEICFSHDLDQPAICIQPLTIEVQTDMRKVRFVYDLKVKVSSLEDVQLLAPKGTYKEEEGSELPEHIIPAFPAGRNSRTYFHVNESFYVEKLDKYEVPKDIHDQVMGRDKYTDFNPWMMKDAWKTRLHNLLWIEEVAQEKLSRRYDLRNALIAKVPPVEIVTNKIFRYADSRDTFSEIEVPGLAEKRPSVLYNDRVYAWIEDDTNEAYEGWVYRVKENSIIVMFDNDFHNFFEPDTRFHVRFRFNRMPMRLAHRAVDKMNLDLIWPSVLPKLKNKRFTRQTVPWTDPQIQANNEQADAIVNMLNGTNGKAPYLIFGPFGTGKTRTLMEYTKQVLNTDEDAKLLICTHSNSGSDLILTDLIESNILSPEELFRLYSFNHSRHRIKVPNYELYARFDEDKQIFLPPPVDELKDYRVVLCTAGNSATLYGIGVGNQHFTHIFIDEAAMMTEPEIYNPLCLASSTTKILLLGDEKQVGPVIFSDTAREHGLQLSLMERLIKTSDLYRTRNMFVCTNLVKNYRSHPKITALLSKLFYDNKLISCTKPKDYQCAKTWGKKGTAKDFPFLFSALNTSKEDREADSPSFFNIDEQVRTLKQEDVLVLSATRKQTEKLRELFRTKSYRLYDVYVASTEEVHGKEYKAVFISTVRSSTQFLQYDKQFNLGFFDAKRFNTAISRAVGLVVIVGNSKILEGNAIWRETKNYCAANNSFINPEGEYNQEDHEDDEDDEDGGDDSTDNLMSLDLTNSQSASKVNSNQTPVQYQKVTPMQQVIPVSVPMHAVVNNWNQAQQPQQIQVHHTASQAKRPLLPKHVQNVADVESQFAQSSANQPPGSKSKKVKTAYIAPEHHLNDSDSSDWVNGNRNFKVLCSYEGRDLMIAYTDRNFEGYPPFSVVDTGSELIISFALLSLTTSLHFNDGILIHFHRSSTPQLKVLAGTSLLPFNGREAPLANSEEDVPCCIKINVPPLWNYGFNDLTSPSIIVLTKTPLTLSTTVHN